MNSIQTQAIKTVAHTQIRPVTLRQIRQTAHKVTPVIHMEMTHVIITKNDARGEYVNKTSGQSPQEQPEKKVHKTIHHKYEALNLKLENPYLTV